MGKNKRPPVRGDRLIDRFDKSIADWRRAAEETERQYMVDLICLTLNDPEIMGKDVFGYSRLRRVIQGVMNKYDDYHDALTLNPEADYYQAKLDQALRQAIPEEHFDPFNVRYEYIRERGLERRRHDDNI